MPEPPKIDSDLMEEITALADTVAGRADHADLAARLEWLIDTLILRDQLPASFRRLVDKIKARDRSAVRLSVFRDKYSVPSPDIDCASLIPLCGARCCTFEVTLSAQDVVEQSVPFDVMQPYVIPRSNGRCVCMDDAGACTIYDKRPGTCRAYDCRHDARVWIDFDAKIPAPRR